MKTEVKHEHGDWIVSVGGNPKFGFIYKEEAEAVAEMIDALIVAYKSMHTLKDDNLTQSLCNMRDLVTERLENDSELKQIEQALTKAGVEL